MSAARSENTTTEKVSSPGRTHVPSAVNPLAGRAAPDWSWGTITHTVLSAVFPDESEAW